MRGALAMARLARRLHKRELLLPAVSAEEAAQVDGVAVYRVDSLARAARERAPPAKGVADPNAGTDFSEIKGQHSLRRAIEVAVAGNHNLLMISYISPDMD